MVEYLQKTNHSLKDFSITIGQKPVPNALKMEMKKMEFKKIESEVHKFEKVGDNLAGTLIGVEKAATGNNKVYKIRTKEGKIKAVFGTTILTQLLDSVVLNQEIQILFTGTKPNKDKAKNDIKLFEVYVAAE